MNDLVVGITFSDDKLIPKYQTKHSGAMDLYAKEQYEIEPGKTVIVSTGIKLNMPNGYCAQVLSRSGLAAKNSVFVLNAPGLIDNDYADEIKVILHNAGNEMFIVNQHDRVAQIMFLPYMQVSTWRSVDENNNVRIIQTRLNAAREGGLGSTGR